MFRFSTHRCLRWALAALLTTTLVGNAVEGQPPPQPLPPSALSQPPVHPEDIRERQFSFKLDPDLGAEKLLPIPPKFVRGPVRLVSDLAQVPEMFFQDPFLLADEGKALPDPLLE